MLKLGQVCFVIAFVMIPFLQGCGSNSPSDVGENNLTKTNAGGSNSPAEVVKSTLIKANAARYSEVGVAQNGSKASKGPKDAKDAENIRRHWEKHGSEFPDLKNEKEYAQKSQDLLNSPSTNVMKKIRNNGDVFRYDPATNTFGAFRSDGSLKTMFKPTDGANYWKKQ